MGDSKAISCAQSASLKEQAFEQAHLEQLMTKNHNHQNSQ